MAFYISKEDVHIFDILDSDIIVSIKYTDRKSKDFITKMYTKKKCLRRVAHKDIPLNIKIRKVKRDGK